MEARNSIKIRRHQKKGDFQIIRTHRTFSPLPFSNTKTKKQRPPCQLAPDIIALATTITTRTRTTNTIAEAEIGSDLEGSTGAPALTRGIHIRTGVGRGAQDGTTTRATTTTTTVSTGDGAERRLLAAGLAAGHEHDNTGRPSRQVTGGGGATAWKGGIRPKWRARGQIRRSGRR